MYGSLHRLALSVHFPISDFIMQRVRVWDGRFQAILPTCKLTIHPEFEMVRFCIHNDVVPLGHIHGLLGDEFGFHGEVSFPDQKHQFPFLLSQGPATFLDSIGVTGRENPSRRVLGIESEPSLDSKLIGWKFCLSFLAGQMKVATGVAKQDFRRYGVVLHDDGTL